MTSALLQSKTLDGIQYLRGIAAVMVVVHHALLYFGEAAHSWSSFGSRGVDLFFIISGFIMAYVTRGFAAEQPRGPQVQDFLLRRLLRIAPLYWLALLLTARHVILAGDVDLNLLKDFLFLPHWNGEATGIPSPILIPGWTINYEMFFYAVFAGCMCVGRYRYLLLFSLFLALIALGFLIESDNAFWVFYTNFILTEFLLGVLLFQIISRTEGAPSRTVALLVMVGGWVALYLANDVFGIHYLFGVACVAIVWGALYALQGIKSKALLLVGDASYAIYLFHLFVIGYGARIFQKIGLVEAEPMTVVLVLAGQVLLVIAFSILLHLYVEKPLLAWGQESLKALRNR